MNINIANLPRFNTLEDMYNFQYTEMIKKADDPIISTSSGFVNPIYGQELFSALSQESNAFGLLPKFSYQRKGFRAITANEATTAGVAENAAWGEKDKPAITEVAVPLKTVKTQWDQSMQELIYEGNDDVVATADLKGYFNSRHKSAINAQLLGTNGTVAGYNLESLDRVCASYLEDTTYTDAANAAYDANDNDIYSQDRDAAASWVDAYVSGSTTDRAFSTDLILDVLSEVEYYDGKTNVMLTGKDTYADIEKAFDGYVRYNAPIGALGASFVELTVNGVKTVNGTGKGTRTAEVYGVPLFKSKDVVAETSGSSRIYLLDTGINPLGTTPKLGMKMGLLPTVFESKDVLANDNFGYKYGIATVAELQCEIFRHQGKIRDLA